MNCEICQQNEAIIHIHQVSGNKKSTYHICEICAQDMGFTSLDEKTDYSIGNLFKGLFKLKKKKAIKTGSKTCPHCSWTIEQFRRTKSLGCPGCYSFFQDEIAVFYSKKLKVSTHAGKFPKKIKSYKKFFVDVLKLKNEMDNAVQNEEFEKAAQLRDEIGRLKETMWLEQ
jgi:protein arginine kinase activator